MGRFALDAETIPEDAHVAAVSARLPEGAWPDALRLMALDAETGELVQLGPGAGITVGRGVAAARALPGVLPTVTVGGRRLMDAGGRLGHERRRRARGVQRVLVITPAAADPRPGSVDAAQEAGLACERIALEGAGLTVDVIRADDAARDAMGDQLYGIVDAATAVSAGRDAGRSVAAAI